MSSLGCIVVRYQFQFALAAPPFVSRLVAVHQVSLLGYWAGSACILYFSLQILYILNVFTTPSASSLHFTHPSSISSWLGLKGCQKFLWVLCSFLFKLSGSFSYPTTLAVCMPDILASQGQHQDLPLVANSSCFSLEHKDRGLWVSM